MIPRRKPLKRSSKPIPRTAVRKKRPGVRRGQPTKAEKAVIRHRIYLRSGGQCDLRNMPDCWKGVIPEDGGTPWDHWHLVHLKSRGSGGTWDDENLCGGCPSCHLQGLHNSGGKPCPPKPKGATDGPQHDDNKTSCGRGLGVEGRID